MSVPILSVSGVVEAVGEVSPKTGEGSAIVRLSNGLFGTAYFPASIADRVHVGVTVNVVYEGPIGEGVTVTATPPRIV